MKQEPALDIFSIVNFVGVGQAVFWAIALLGIKRHNKTANRMLAGLLFALAVGVASETLYTTQYILQIPHFTQLATPLMFLYPPLVFLYVKALTSAEFALKRNLSHFVPFLVSTFYFLPVYFLTREEKLELLQQGDGALRSEAAVISVLILIIELAYIAGTLNLLRNHASKVRNSYSTLDQISLHWLRNVIFGFMIVTVLYFFFSFTNWTSVAKSIVPASVTVFVYVLGYQAIRQPEVFIQPQSGYRKYQKSGLTEERAGAYLQKVVRFMEREKPYLDANLTLQELAGRVSISLNHLSQLLNERLNQTFFDFVNSYRVQEAKRELCNPAKAHLTILAIAYDVGFNSKSSFNSAFKKHTGITPSEFKRRLKTTA